MGLPIYYEKKIAENKVPGFDIIVLDASEEHLLIVKKQAIRSIRYENVLFSAVNTTYLNIKEYIGFIVFHQRSLGFHFMVFPKSIHLPYYSGKIHLSS